jgi:hypothetical protein
MSVLSKWFRTPAPTRSNLRARPRLEALEDRRLMAAGVTYHLGAVIPNVKVETVYWGSDWYLGGQNNLSQQAQQYDNFFKVLTNSSYVDLLNQYGAYRGQFLGDYKTDYQQPTKTVNDGQIQAMLSHEIRSSINSYSLPRPDGNTLYVVVLPPNVESSTVINGATWTSGFEKNLKHFYAYHNSFSEPGLGNVFYAVIANPTGNQRIDSLDVFQQMTEVGSHEMAEAVTNPNGGGWYDGSGNEIGDLANKIYGNYQGYVVQQEWSNKDKGPVMPKPDASNRTDLGGWVSAISVVSNANGLQEAFGIGGNGAIWHKWQLSANSNSWSGWNQLDGLSGVQSFAVGRNANGKLQVFAVDGAGHVETINQAPSANWGGHWSSLGGPLYPSSLKVKTITIGLNTSGYQQVFAIDANNEVRTWETVHSPIGGYYQTWADLGEKAQALKVYTYANGQMELFGIDVNGQAVHSWQSGSGWSPWYGLGGGKVLALDVGQDADGMPELFAIRADHSVETIKHAYLNDWGKAWTNLGGWVSSISVGTNQDGRLEVFGVGSDRSLYAIAQMAPRDNWAESTWFKMAGTFKDGLAVNHEKDGRLAVFGIGSGNNLVAFDQTIPSGSWN